MTRPGKTKQLNISIPNEVDAVLDEVARKEHRSKSNLITHIIFNNYYRQIKIQIFYDIYTINC